MPFDPAMDAAALFTAPTEAEEARLEQHEVVIRPLPTTDRTVAVQGVVDVDASVDHVWGVLLDFDARKRASSMVKTVDAYKPATDSDRWVRFEVGMLGASMVYYNHYVLSPARETIAMELDPAMHSDLTASHGSYVLSVPRPGVTRVVYTTETEFGPHVPMYLQRWLATSGVADYLAKLIGQAT